MTPPITIYLIGFAGSGKYTIAKEIAQFGYKVVDNQLINNPIFSLLDLDGITPISEKAWASIATIRTAVMGFVSSDKSSNFVFTNELYDVEIDYIIYNQVKNAAVMRGSLFIPIKLNVSLEERARRITNPERRTRFKTTKLAETHSKREFIKIDHPYLLEIDVSDLSAEQAAGAILNFIDDVKNESNFSLNT